MEIEKSSKTVLKFNDSVYTSCYVSSWCGGVELTFKATDEAGVSHSYEISLPLVKAESLVNELTTDIAGHHEEQRKRREEKEAEEREEEVEV